MAVISEEELNSIRAKVNIVDVISKYIPLTQKGRNYFGVCPFHEDHAPSMSVSVDKQIYKCFSCGAAGNVFSFVQNYENVSWLEAVSIVSQFAGIALDISKQTPKTDHFLQEHEIMELSSKFYINNLKSSFGLTAKNYLLERGINEEIIEEFKIGVSTDDYSTLKNVLISKEYQLKTVQEIGLVNDREQDIFQRRIMFPLWDDTGKVIGFSGRIYRNESDAKYVNSRENKLFKKGNILYNYHNAANIAKREGYIILVEGFMDAIRISANGHKNVVALMGTAMTSNQMYLLKKLRTKIYMCLDNDRAGIQATIDNGSTLIANNLNVSVIKLSDHKDADEYILNKGSDSFDNLIKNPVNYYDFRLNYFKENKNLNDPHELAAYINEVINLVKDIQDPILKSVMLNNLSKDYDIDIELLKQRVNFEETNKKPVIVNTKKEIVKKNIVDDIAKVIIYYLMTDGKYIKIYKEKLGYIDNLLLRNITNEILYYYEEHKIINIADFISYMGENELRPLVEEILGITIIEEINEENMLQYVNSYLRLTTKQQIAELKKKIKDELDINKKMQMTIRIAELKKGV